MNNNGQVIGYFAPSPGVQHGFLSTSGSFLDLGTLGGLSSRAARPPRGAPPAFVYANGSMTDLGTLGGQNSLAEAISNNGNIAGSAQTAGGFSNAFLSAAGGAMQSLGTLPLDESSRGYGVNSAGQVVGDSRIGPVTFPEFQNHVFLFSGGTMMDLGTCGSSYSQAAAIRDVGQVVGWCGVAANVNHAFLYRSAGITDLGTFAGIGSSGAYGINNAGQVVSWSDLPDAGSLYDRAFLYEGGALIDLNTLIDPASGWTIDYAIAINNHRQIAAFGCNGALCQSLRLDLVPAVPEPHTYSMLLAGVGLVGWTLDGRRRSGRRPAPH